MFINEGSFDIVDLDKPNTDQKVTKVRPVFYAIVTEIDDFKGSRVTIYRDRLVKTVV